MYGKLYLFPVSIGTEDLLRQLPAYNLELIRTLNKFIAEDAKTARRFLKSCGYPQLDKAEILLLNEHTKSGELSDLMSDLLEGQNVGLMSDAGCPGIADPGAEVVRLAHQKGIEVVPLVGPSSIVLSIMASGFNGQNFAFVGYLPIEKPQKIKKLKELEQLALKQHQAQFFIETPYRNEQMFETALECLGPHTLLLMGKDLNSEGQVIRAKTIADWRKGPKPALHKVPVVFGIFH
ncbi:MAG: SAM-dependent methyltransferase [bacterium]|nr:SAM-dependent methyltransferase [bacterium]